MLFTRGYISNYREQSNINLPQQGDYATGIIMMGPDIVEKAEQAFNELAEQCDLEVRIKLNDVFWSQASHVSSSYHPD